MLAAWIACFACYCPHYRQFWDALKCADVIYSLIYISLLNPFLIYSGRNLIDSVDIIGGMRIDPYSREIFIAVVCSGVELTDAARHAFSRAVGVHDQLRSLAREVQCSAARWWVSCGPAWKIARTWGYPRAEGLPARLIRGTSRTRRDRRVRLYRGGGDGTRDGVHRLDGATHARQVAGGHFPLSGPRALLRHVYANFS